MASSMFNNSISISMSDDDSDELAGKMKVRVRRKRKKLGFRGKNNFFLRMFWKLMKWWTVLLFLPAIGLLIFESSRISGKPSEVKKPDFVAEEKAVGNLNRLDPTTRVVGGVRERCLKLLPPEQLEILDIPVAEETSFPVRRVVYKSDSGTSYLGGNAILLERHTEATRFNLFTGNQTLQEREQSYKANETAVVHCGFYSENGGFRVSDEEKNYMKTCKAVVTTCAFGGGDDLYQPIGMSSASLQKVCYVAFWDEITLAAQEAEGKRIDENHMIGKWRIVVVRDLPFTDQRLNDAEPSTIPSSKVFNLGRFQISIPEGSTGCS